MTINPFAVWFRPAPTQAQIIVHDRKIKQRALVDHELQKIKLRHELATLDEQFAYLQLAHQQETKE